MFTANRLARSGRSCWARREARSCCQSLATAVWPLECCASSRKNVRSRVHRRSAKEHTYRARTRIYIDTRFSGIQKQNRSPSQCSEARSFLRWSTTGEIWRLQAVWGRARACLRFLVGVHARSLRQSDDLCFLHNRSRLKGDRQ